MRSDVLRGAFLGAIAGVAVVLCLFAGMVVYYGSEAMVQQALYRVEAKKADRLAVPGPRAAHVLHLFYPVSGDETVAARVPMARAPYVNPKQIRVVEYR